MKLSIKLGEDTSARRLERTLPKMSMVLSDQGRTATAQTALNQFTEPLEMEITGTGKGS